MPINQMPINQMPINQMPIRRINFITDKTLRQFRKTYYGFTEIYNTLYKKESEYKKESDSKNINEKDINIEIAIEKQTLSKKIKNENNEKMKERNIKNKEPEIGDLVVIKCELNFGSVNNQYLKFFTLPKNLENRFVAVEASNPTVIKQNFCSSYFPILSLNVFLNTEEFLELTETDYEESAMDTKIWNQKNIDGITQKDYVIKRSWLKKTEKFSDGILIKNDYKSKNVVEFYSVVWKENDIITSIPGYSETRKKSHWFMNNWTDDIQYQNKEKYIKLPIVGVVGTLLDKKIVTHSLTKDGKYIGGNNFETMFYKILLGDRIPLWVDSPVWKCPEDLMSPIYLPIP